MTIPPYNPNTPQRVDESLDDTQIEFLNNFINMYQIFAVNHTNLDDPVSPGNHTYVNFLDQVGSIQTNVTEISVYSKAVEGQTSQLFYRQQGNGPEIQLSNYQIYSVGQKPGQLSFFTSLPGGIIVYFGLCAQLPNNLLRLYPPVAKKIITAVFCPSNPTNLATPKPQIKIPDVTDEIFSSIEVTNGVGIGAVAPGCYYLVMGNI